MEQRIETILSGSKTVAVVGISDKPDRPSHVVAKYLQGRGYRVIPVNPLLTEVLGEKAYKSLAEIPGRVDLIVEIDVHVGGDLGRRNRCARDVVHGPDPTPPSLIEAVTRAQEHIVRD